MLTSSAALVVRDATVRDAFEVTQTLVAALTDSRLGSWLGMDDGSLSGSLLPWVAAVVTQATDSGIVRVVEENGRVVAAALWSLETARPVGVRRAFWPVNNAQPDVRSRWKLLEEVAQTRRPLHPAHQRLALLGVHPDRQGEGLSNYLLIGHHALLDVMGVAAYALADESSRGLLSRHGYTAVGESRLLPGRMPVWAMWRPPAPADRG
uniref:hypothetical protein n=1 Tax=Paractinoplanes polyasparticus TaxID=2856853 RepID=UPI001C85908E|nr:hypothetical protein [Actinoplanes polyasparticus]